ncbi:MAG: Thiol:disulfide interchange protein DsbD [Chroococcopsis gigantea SAG 12.99]|jgi:cytochrome c-type biogenesis protein|nr:Thiol:disulfide interchange protein DsbD [Chroococcopsis gigantea SAG 12.99]
MFDALQTQLYYLQQWATVIVSQQLGHLTPLSAVVIFSAGLLTSLTPCMLSMLPITIGYIGGYQESGRFQSILQSVWFALGLATTLAGLGIAASVLGKVYGQIGLGLPIIVSLIAIIMGLNLLEVISLRFPSLGATDWISSDFPPSIRSYLLGLTFGLIASPCSTPVLASLLAWVASTGDLFLGAGLLLFYTLGYVLPLILVGIFTSSLKRLLSLRQWSGLINPLSGILLIGFGVFSLLSRLPLSYL